MTTITTTAVAPNDLIESSWGNAVRTDLTNLNADKAELAGATFTGAVSGVAPTLAAHLTRKDYVDGVVNGLVERTGDTMTGSLTFSTTGTGVILPAGEPSAANRAARRDYVDTQVATRVAKTGDTMTGNLTFTTSGSGVVLPTGEPSAANRAARRDYVDNAVADRLSTSGGTVSGLITASAGVNVPSPGDNSKATNRGYVDGLIATRLPLSGGTLTSALSINNADVPNVTSGGASTLQDAGRIMNTVSAVNVQNLWLKRYGSFGAANNGQRYVTFLRGLTDTEIGHISIASSTTVSYNTSSDPRLKTRTGAIVDALDRVRELGRRAFRGYWTEDPENEWDFLSSNDVEDVAPYAVTGERDAVREDGAIVPQMIDAAKLVPLLAAAVAQLADLIEGARP